MARLFILSGASGCGKTTLLNSVAAVDPADADDFTRAVRAPKFSEREVRNKPNEIDDITHVENIRLGTYDIAYVLNNRKYGIRLESIRELLDAGYNALVIVSDFRVVKQLKECIGPQALALYISSAIDADRLRRIQQERLGFRPTEEQKAVLSYHFARSSAAARLGWWDRVSDCVAELEGDWRAYATDSRSTEIRAEKIRAFHVRYIEHLHLFNHVILNYAENKPEEMTHQFCNLLSGIDEFEPRKRSLSYPPVFVVAAASGAGKGELLEMLNFIGTDKVRITSKLAKRSPKDEDRRDGMIALVRSPNDPEPEWPEWWTSNMRETGSRGEFPDEYDLRWEFHKMRGSDRSGTPYAVSAAEIQRNIDERVPQIFVSNMGEFDRFRRLWPNNVVFIYLHRLVSSHENREFQLRKWSSDPQVAEVRIAEKEEVHATYIEKIAEFNHVLLNTSFQEDLYDQMFRLLEFYGQNDS